MTLPSLNHFNYDELDQHCHCPLCEAERDAATIYTNFTDIHELHIWTCQCKECKQRGKLYEDLLLATVKRDTYSELSYLVQKHPEKGPFLAWVWRTTQHLNTQKKTFSRNWWINRGIVTTLGWWFRKWHMVSGVDLLADLDKP